MQDIDLIDTLIGQSFNDEISKSLSSNQSDIQTNFDTPRSNTFTFNFKWPRLWPAVKVTACKEQHSDLEIYSLFDSALDENERSPGPVCYYVKNDNWMRKWRPLDVLVDDEWTVNHQIVVSRAYRPEK